MQFFNELWFVLKNVPTLAHLYEGKSVIAGIFLALSIASTLVKNRLIHSTDRRRKLLKWITRISYGLTALIFLMAFVDLVKDRLPFDDIVCTDAAVDAYYFPPESRRYELVRRLRCSNRTNNPIRNLAPVMDGYYEEIPNWTVESKLMGGPPIDLVVQAISRAEKVGNNFPGTSKTIYLYQASARFEPSLPSGADFDWIYRITASGAPIETSAFTSAGTVFALGVDYDTLSYDITIHAPSGYKIVLFDSQVVDPNGKATDPATNRQTKPRVSITEDLAEWDVNLARKHLRYLLKYKFEYYGWVRSAD